MSRSSFHHRSRSLFSKSRNSLGESITQKLTENFFQKRKSSFLFPFFSHTPTHLKIPIREIADRSHKNGSVRGIPLKESSNDEFSEKNRRSHFHFSEISFQKDCRSHFWRKWRSTHFSEMEITKNPCDIFSHFFVYIICYTPILK